jgi:hypothetical protein
MLSNNSKNSIKNNIGKGNVPKSNGINGNAPNGNAPNGNTPKKNSKLFMYVMLALIVIIIGFFIYTLFMGFRNYQKYSPYLVEGIVDGTIARKVEAKLLPISSDTQYGTEFTYSFWIFIKDTNFTMNSSGSCSTNELPLLHVFHKGSNEYNNQTQNNNVHYPLLQMPGVWLYPNTNKLNIRFNTYDNVVETADVGNIPLNLWSNIVIVLIGNSVDVYVNGNLKKRTKLNGVPKINYGDFFMSYYGGFNGYLSKVRYFNNAIQPFQIDKIFEDGPSRTFESNSNSSLGAPAPSLSANYWMTTGFPNMVGTPGYNQNTQTTA